MALEAICIGRIAYDLPWTSFAFCKDRAVWGETGHVVMPLGRQKGFREALQMRIAFPFCCQMHWCRADFPVGTMLKRCTHGLSKQLSAQTGTDYQFPFIYTSAYIGFLGRGIIERILFLTARRILRSSKNYKHIRSRFRQVFEQPDAGTGYSGPHLLCPCKVCPWGYLLDLLDEMYMHNPLKSRFI